MNAPGEEAAMLRRIALEDYKAFRKLIDDPEIDLRIAAFFGQQTLEKLFKAVLSHKGVIFPPTHNLEKLAELLNDAGTPLPLAEEVLKRLNPYAVAFRYDDRDIPTISRELAQAQVERLVAWAGQQLQS